MKKLFVMLTAIAALSISAAELHLEVDPSSEGFVDSKTVDAAAVSAAGFVTLRVVVRNVDFGDLAGFEASFDFLPFLHLANTNQVGQADAPFTLLGTADGWGSDNVQVLPADENGNPTVATFDNASGTFRIGAISTNANDRPTNRDVVVAVLRVSLGRDYSIVGGPNARDRATCISATEYIDLVQSSDARNYIVADGNADAVSVDTPAGALRVTVTNSSTTLRKSDVNSDGNRNNSDFFPMVVCLFLPTNAGCPLASASASDFETIMDANCDGNINNADFLPHIVNIILNSGRDAAAKMGNEENFTLSGNKGELTLRSGGKGVMAVGELVSDAKLGRLTISESAKRAGWTIVDVDDWKANARRFAVVNLNGEDGMIPEVSVAFEATKKGANLWLRENQIFNMSTERVSMAMPSLNETLEK